MEILSRELLLEAYEKARKFGLDDDFIQLILEELNRRGMEKELKNLITKS